MGAHSFYVYILASRIGGTLYVAVTSNTTTFFLNSDFREYWIVRLRRR